ncbi:NAD(P)-dependent oxidoreductase [Flavobacterium noncentrifugens]|uniref:dTDP-4-dehydrorhamnose reductase n=1 Tax=Flavobacterium noncentrifugens TaxID=1128970 RepID=A0A1G8SZI5_9FLAO|nr:dTDP-4-dehydrorhamnose reductase [Flavobacterium noncentrifugens]GEP50025.1 NAD(P)-dependent oxidoreductase [Flavobacterium noncentrifugens]SDJ34563.1 dTDP-4-dehydrorhamnose reductase [Flavobacterium noncentrifugens]
MVVLVTGAAGQLGQALQFISDKYSEIQFRFFTSSELNITDAANCEAVFSEIKPDYCINAAAYTAVDKAESEPEKAFAINVTGAKNLAEACKKNNTKLIHVSTDFVFDGLKTTPYTEEDFPNPTGVYGQTKLDGEKAVQQTWPQHFIIRTSWVYSQFANNFMKTMIRLGNEKDQLNVVSDQTGTPTHAVDLAEALVAIIQKNPENAFGIYNFSNEGQCSWYDFAKEIFEVNHIKIDLQPIPTSAYPTPAKRPAYSVLDKSKIRQAFGIPIANWEEALSAIRL